MRLFYFCILIVSIIGCKSTHVAKPIEELSKSSLVGHWEIKEFVFVIAPSSFTDDIKQAFVSKIVAIGNVFFEDSGIYSATLTEGQEQGKWDLENGTVVIEKEGGETDSLLVSFYDENSIKGELRGGDGVKAKVTLKRTFN